MRRNEFEWGILRGQLLVLVLHKIVRKAKERGGGRVVGQASAVRNTLVGVAKGLVGSASGADIEGLHLKRRL